MDSKIIAAIIIGVAMVTSVYLYTQDTAFNRCVNAAKKIGVTDEDKAFYLCITEQENYKK